MSTESLLWVPVIAMLLFTVTYMCFFLSICVCSGRTKLVSAHFLFFYLFYFIFFFFRITFEVLLTSLSRAGMGLS